MQRNRRPPRDPVNALLSLAYSMLVKDLTIACYSLGFDPYWGFYHQPRFGRPALALDLGAISTADCGFGRADSNQYGDGNSLVLHPVGTLRGAEAKRAQGILPRL
jgi:hypothetical protein